MDVARELDEGLTEEEIEELIIGAIRKDEMIQLGTVRSEEASKNERNFQVNKKQFTEILSSDTNESKLRIPKDLNELIKKP